MTEAVRLFRIPEDVRRQAPGHIKAFKASADKAIVASFEDPAPLEGGPPDELHARWHVLYMSIRRDEEGEVKADVRMREQYLDEFDAGAKFGELVSDLPQEEVSPPFVSEDPLERKAWAKEQLEVAYQLAESNVMRGLRQEAARLARGETSYPPEESALYEILREIGALPGRGGASREGNDGT
jgi:hypothetical protein